MKQTSTNGNWRNPERGSSLRKACGASCRKIRAQIAGVKEAIFAESSRAFSAPERLVRLALNEAEAAAWQTKYPHLVFPALATEKVRAVAAWNARQKSVRENSPVIVLTA
ncbi:MAG: hypothetical protein ABSC89_16690 [Verrucomicrobiota bacterium]|jgi:hypothetical protein